MKTKYFLPLLVCFTLCISLRAPSQSFSDLVEQLGVKDLAAQYLKPAADAIGYNFNSGLYHSARIDTGLHFYFGVKAMWTLIPESELSFQAKLPAYLTTLGYPTEVTTATAFGGKGATLHSNQRDPNGNPYPDIQFPDGINQRNTFLIVPHLTIGSLLATEVMIRATPPVTLDPEIGKLTFYGGGIKHSPSQYLNLPIDVSVMISFQQFKIGEVLEVSNYNANIHASKNFTIVTLYGGFGYEGYDIKASYIYTPTMANLPPELRTAQKFDFDFTGRNFRFTVGANFEFIPLVDVNIDYSFGAQDNLTIGAGLSL